MIRNAGPERLDRRAALLVKLRENLLGVALLVALIAVLCGMAWYLRIAPMRDRKYAPLESARAKVVSITLAPTGPHYPGSYFLVRVNMNGQELQAKSTMAARVGQTVRIRYRRGKSGNLYVEQVEPLTPGDP